MLTCPLMIMPPKPKPKSAVPHLKKVSPSNVIITLYDDHVSIVHMGQ